MKRWLWLVSLFVFAGCSGSVERVVDLQEGTVREVYDLALDFARTEHPEAVLVGYTNHGPTVDRRNYVPSERALSGSLDYWAYVFAKSPEVIEDKVLDDGDVFSVEFDGGRLVLTGFAETRGWEIEDERFLGDEILAYDSDVVFDELMREVEKYGDEEVYHVDYNVFLDSHEISLFVADDRGYSGFFNVEEGIFYNMMPFEITY